MFLSAYLDFVFRIRRKGLAGSIQVRGEWLQKWAIEWLKIMQVTVRVEGELPERGILASNHLSYMDVIVYASLRPFVFLSKSEVKSWPVAGPLTQCAGTLYIVRQNKSDVMRLGGEMKPVVAAGLIVVVFLEGTSTDGNVVLPFRSSLLAPAEEQHWPVTPGCIDYRMAEGNVSDEICYWGEMTFFPHLLNLLGTEKFEARVQFGKPIQGEMNRKQLATQLHEEVCRMKFRNQV